MESYLEAAIEIAREAGDLLNSYAQRRIGFELKGEFDLVTEADKASEKLIVARLKARFPDHDIVAEEGGGHDSGSCFRWYVDPLDGTTNFAHGFPVYNVTLGLQRDGEMIAGVILDPTRPELFAAERGCGAWRNGERIRVSSVSRLEDSLTATGFPSRKRHQNVNIHFYHQIGMATHGVRRAGAAAIDLAYVACGRLEAFWEFGLNPWDMAAGILLVREAGGNVTDMYGEHHHLHAASLVADNGIVHRELIDLFRDVFAGRNRYPLPVIS